MAELLARQKSSIITPHKGEILPGVITKLTSGEILVDINAKTEATVLEKDKKLLHKLLSMLKVGDKVKAQVLNPESDFGNPVVSLRRFIDDILWENLLSLQKTHTTLEVIVDSATKGGFLVTTQDGASGFLPNSQTSSLVNPQEFIGKKIKVVILELNRDLRKIIFSQKQVLGISDFQKLTKDLKSGQKIKGTVLNITPFGLFVSIPITETATEGFVHVSEVSWESASDMAEKFKVGESIEAIVLGKDLENRQIRLSIKRLTANPYEKKLEEYPLDKKIKAKVMKVATSGVFLEIGENITGIIKKEKIPPKTSYKEGMEIEVVVSGVDKKRQRVELTPVLLEKPIGYR